MWYCRFVRNAQLGTSESVANLSPGYMLAGGFRGRPCSRFESDRIKFMIRILERCEQHLNNIQQKFFTPSQDLSSGFAYWREKILRIVLGTGLALGFLVFIPSVVVVFRAGYWWLALFDLMIYLAMIALMLAVQIKYTIRAGLIVLTCYATGFWIIYNVGFLSGGPTWLFLFAVFAGILLGVWAAVVSVGLNALTLEVSDDGEGIRQEDLNRIFEPF
jgi:hypothetical protein